MRCSFCAFDRTQRFPDPTWSAVQSLRELAVHLVLGHPELWRELAETVSDEWAARLATPSVPPEPASPEAM